jgi:hypothetical protein
LANETRYSTFLAQQADAVTARFLAFYCSWVSIYYAQKAARPPIMFGKETFFQIEAMVVKNS